MFTSTLSLPWVVSKQHLWPTSFTTPSRTLQISSGWTGIWIQVRLVVPRRTIRRTTSTVRSTTCSTWPLGPMERTDLRWARRCLWASRERTCLWTLQRRTGPTCSSTCALRYSSRQHRKYFPSRTWLCRLMTLSSWTRTWMPNSSEDTLPGVAFQTRAW